MVKVLFVVFSIPQRLLSVWMVSGIIGPQKDIITNAQEENHYDTRDWSDWFW